MLSVAEFQAFASAPPDHRLAYGEAASQFGELRVPAGGGPHPVVVLIHGGCWKEPYAASRELGPLGDALKAEGVATWNIEYRRLYEPGSGWPGTYLDIGGALDHLRVIADAYRLDLDRVVVVGHSAGGHLAMWAAARARLPEESRLHVADPLPVRGVINLAGTMDMTDNIETMHAGCRDTVVTGMLGGTPQEVPERYAHVSVMRLVPLGVPQVLIWDEHDEFLPLPLAQNYLEAATRAGDTARLIVVPGVGHFDLASPFTDAWPVLRSSIGAMLNGTLPV
jgi:acetyl esterase/lipase